MDGSVSVVVPQEALGTVVCHGGCARFLDDGAPSVATSRDADLQILMSSASAGSSESLPSISDPDTSIAWTLDWRCPCQCLKEPMLRARAENLRSTLKLLSRDGRRQSVWAELGQLHEQGRLRFSLFRTSCT